MADTRQDRGRANTEPHHFDVVRRQLNAPPHWANQTLQAWSAALPQEKKLWDGNKVGNKVKELVTLE